MTNDDRNYELKPTKSPPIDPIEVADRPPTVTGKHPIGLIGCGGITETHLKAYRAAGFEVIAMMDLDRQHAIGRRDEFYPEAEIFDDYQTLIRNSGATVIDIATPASVRVPIIESALKNGRHVLSQKPFVTDIAEGHRLADLADSNHCKLAVNQNGRWAPHLAHLREVVRDGIIGEVMSLTVDIHWDHNWIAGTPFDQMPHVVLEDFAIHWFDFVASVMPGVATTVYATVAHSPGQTAKPPLIGSCVLRYPRSQVVMNFDADAKHGAEDRTALRGTKGAAYSVGPSLTEQTVTVHTEDGWYRPQLHGDWFTEGFIGTMAELMSSVEQDRVPLNDARDNLRGLRMSAAAIESASTGLPCSVMA